MKVKSYDDRLRAALKKIVRLKGKTQWRFHRKTQTITNGRFILKTEHDISYWRGFFAARAMTNNQILLQILAELKDINRKITKDPITTGGQLRKLRESAGMTRAELADTIGVGVSTISNYENAIRKPKGRMKKALARALGITFDELNQYLNQAGSNTNDKR